MQRRIIVASAVAPAQHSINGFAPRLFHLLRALAATWQVHLLVLHDGSPGQEPEPHPDVTTHEFVGGPRRLGGRGPTARVKRLAHYAGGRLPYISTPRRAARLDELIGRTSPAGVVLFHPAVAHLALRLPPALPVVCGLEEGSERVLATSAELRPALRPWIASSEARRAARLYDRVGRRAARVVVISEPEREWFARFVAAGKLTVVPHGVDCDYFAPMDQMAQDIDVGVFGDLSQARNADGAIAAVRQDRGDMSGRRLHWALVGRSSERLRSGVDADAQFTGFVEDIRPYYARTKVVMVPSFAGTGVKTTLLEAWAMGRPVVASPHAVQGLPAVDGTNVLVAKDPAGLVARARSALASPDLRRDLGRAGRSTVLSERSAAEMGRRFAAVCTAALEEGRA